MKTNQVIFSAALAAALLTTGALAQSPAPAPSPAPNEIVYVPQLPSPADLTSAATAQGMSVTKIDQTSEDVTVTYKTAGGQMSVISYKPMSAVEAGAPAPAYATTTAQASGPATTTVVYGNPGPSYYPAYGYYPWGWYPPVALSFGFGFHGGGFHGGGFRGGHFGGWGGHFR